MVYRALLHRYLYFIVFSLYSLCQVHAIDTPEKTVLLAILAKNKAHVLPQFFHCIDHLDYDKKLITVYINTNNNQDETENILKQWVEAHSSDYRRIIFEKHEVENIGITKPHEWTPERFKVLAQIRNKSLQQAIDSHCDYYFVVDCDNFIAPYTLKELMAKDKPIIAPIPLLK